MKDSMKMEKCIKSTLKQTDIMSY